MTISEDQAYSELKPHIRRVWNCIAQAYQTYRESPHILVFRKSTRANMVHDLIFANIVAEFDEVAGAKIITQEFGRLRFLSLSDAVTLWFKKLNDERESSNVSTKQAELLNKGQTNLFGEGALLIAGYQLNAEETQVECVSFSPPNLVRPRWFIDVETMPQPIQMGIVQTSQREPRLRIKKGPEQYFL